MFHNVRDKYGRFSKDRKKVKSKSRSVKYKEPARKKNILNAFLLDNSGSMSSKIDVTVKGYNEILASGRQDSNKAGVGSVEMLSFFGDEYEPVQGVVTELINGHTVIQRSGTRLDNKIVYGSDGGFTALWYATTRMIRDIENLLLIQPMGTKVILTIFTDGEENASLSRPGRCTAETVKALIQEKQREGWVINFMGAGEDVFVKAVADSVGIFLSNSMSFDNTAKGVSASLNQYKMSRSTYTSAVANNEDSNIGFFAK